MVGWMTPCHGGGMVLGSWYRAVVPFELHAWSVSHGSDGVVPKGGPLLNTIPRVGGGWFFPFFSPDVKMC